MPLPTSQGLSDLGGIITDYSPVINPSTDLSAAFDTKSRATVAEMSRTASRAFIQFTLGTSPTINQWDDNWGNGISYLPVVAHTATGTYTITWPLTIVDALGATISTNFRVALASVNWDGAATIGILNTKVSSANVVTLKTYSANTLLLNDMTGGIVVVDVK